MKYTLLAMAIAALTSNAYALTGKVVNEQGTAVADAQVEVVGSNTTFTTDEAGQFEIPLDGVDEIHVEADGYNHKVLHLHGENPRDLTIVVSRGVLEIVDVVGIPIHASQIESAQPISVISTKELRRKQAGTLGETLKNEVGVQTSYFGGVASSPIIRGLDGPRVLITQNGLDVSDASRVGPDHVVATEAVTAQQIEILRGPATLFYGSGAIGGVVNVVDDRVPQDNEQKMAFMGERNSINDEAAISAAYTGGADSIAVHVDGFWRDGGDYEIPGIAALETNEEHIEEDHAEHEGGTLENSAAESSGINIGSSLLLNNGYIGVAYGRLDRLNGIPGEGHSEEESEESLAEEQILSELQQDRWQLLSELTLQNPYITALNTRVGYTDYQHAEIHKPGDGEEGESHEEEEGTVFKNSTLQARVDLLHAEFVGWKGALSLESKKVEFEAIGEEAFTPPSTTKELAIALIEEKHIGNFLWQFGARLENVSLSADDVVLDAHFEEGEAAEIVKFPGFDFTPLSLSTGIVWDFRSGYNMGVAVSHSERAPSAAELFAAGPHLATRSFEAGALFEIHEDADEFHLEYVGAASKETSNNIDLTLRKFHGDFGFVVNVFHNKISDYYGLTNSGLTTEDLFKEGAEDEGGEETHGHEESLPVYIFEQNDATFTGLELEFAWQFHRHFKLTLWGDSVEAELASGEYLPRMSPTRLAYQLNFESGPWESELSAVNYFEQNKTAPNETPTGNYTLLDARVSYNLPMLGGNTSIYFAANNLTDEDARVHTSFLKDQAPLPGRNLKLGLHTTF